MVTPHDLREQQLLVERLAEEAAEPLRLLKAYHLPSYEYSVRVCPLAIEIGQINGLSLPELEIVGSAGLLHDFGKCYIPKSILSKSGKLELGECQLLNEHPRLGFIKFPHFELNGEKWEVVRAIIVGHHEYRPNPYPRKGVERRKLKRGKDQRIVNPRTAFLTQIVAIADVFDALISCRSYKAAFPEEEIRRILPNEFRGNPKLVEQILELKSGLKSPKQSFLSAPV